MAFVNEFVSEEEIEKFGLDALMAKHDPFSWQWGKPPGFRHNWTIDRERSIFLMTLKKMTRVGVSGNPEPTTGRLVWLAIQDRSHFFSIDRAPGGSTSIDEVPYRIVWKLVSTNSKFASPAEESLAMTTLREALSTFGAAGVWQQAMNMQVEFIF